MTKWNRVKFKVKFIIVYFELIIINYCYWKILVAKKVKLTVLSCLLCRRSLLKSLEIRKFFKVYPCLQWCRRPLFDYDFTASGEKCFKTLKNCFLGNEISI